MTWPDGAGSATTWFAVWALAAALNVVPAFMPPTWMMLAYFRLYHGLELVPLAAVGALGATTGRAALARLSRAFGVRFLPARWRANAEALAATLESRPVLALPSLGLFALGPLPSNQLFVAAGIAGVPLPPVLAVFFAARFVSYLLWIGAAQAADQTLRAAIGPRVGGVGIAALQIAGFALIVALMQVDWARRLGRTGPAERDGSGARPAGGGGTG